jgi:hypothetical protein
MWVKIYVLMLPESPVNNFANVRKSASGQDLALWSEFFLFLRDEALI